MNKKKIIIIGLAVLSVISVVFIVIMSRKESSPVGTGLGQPVLEQKYKGKYTLTLSVNKSQFDFPEKLPLMENAPANIPLTEDLAKNIALNLGFQGDPTIIDDAIDGTCYFWKKDPSILFAYAKSGIIRYESGTFSPGVNKQMSDTSIISEAQQFISGKGIFGSTQFQMGTIKYMKPIVDGEGFQETDRKNAVLFQISILPKTSDYEFISTSSVEPSSYIQLKQDGSVYTLQATMVSSIQKGITEYRLKTYDELKSSLNETILIELRGKTQLLSDMSPNSIENINITKIEIAYLIESTTSTSFQPVYKLSGEATLNGSQDTYVATLYLPAISK